MSDDHKDIAKELCGLNHTFQAFVEQQKTEFEWRKLHLNFVTKQDLQLMEMRIMAKIDDLIAAATSLSTASDGLSVKLDVLIAKVDAFIAAVPTSDLSPAGEAALSALTAAKLNAAAAGDRVDAEVAKLDPVLPQPAPAGPLG